MTVDPTTKQVGEFTVGNFGIAKNNGFMKNGQWVEKDPFFFWCEWWSPSQAIFPILHKGKTVNITGELCYNSWEDNGVKKDKVFIKILSLDPVEIQKKQDNTGYNPDPYQQPPQQQYQPPQQQYQQPPQQYIPQQPDQSGMTYNSNYDPNAPQ